MRRLDITALSSTYAVRPLTPEDADAVLALAAGNELFYRYHPPLPDRGSILSDMTALPPGKGPEDKYFLGLFQGERLTAVMDLILRYPEPGMAWIGWLILDPACQGRGEASAILRATEAALAAEGFRELRLAVDKGNPQSWAFWHKNGYTRYGPERPNGFSAYLPMKKAL